MAERSQWKTEYVHHRWNRLTSPGKDMVVTGLNYIACTVMFNLFSVALLELFLAKEFTTDMQGNLIHQTCQKFSPIFSFLFTEVRV